MLCSGYFVFVCVGCFLVLLDFVRFDESHRLGSIHLKLRGYIFDIKLVC